MTGLTDFATGPCEPWTDATAALECCPELADTDGLQVLAQAAAEASAILYELSGARYSGICERTVRPPDQPAGCFQILSRGHVIGELPAGWIRDRTILKLPGYPVREILDVTSDGTPVDPTGYRLDRSRLLVRLDTDGNRATWSIDTTVTYLYGADPPLAGMLAAAQLACQLAKACPTPDGTTGDCELPAGTVRVTRQGITVDAEKLAGFLLAGQTGLVHLDTFLTVYGARPSRRTAIWAPEIRPFAQKA